MTDLPKQTNDLGKQVQRQVQRMQKAERERPTLFSQTVFIGTLGLLFVVPVIAGAYLGEWIDGLMADFSSRWTISLIVVGVAVGAFNVYLFIRE